MVGKRECCSAPSERSRVAVIYSYCQRSTYVVVCVTKLCVDQYEMKLSRKNQCSDQ